MAEEFSGTYSEGEEELEKIEATLGDIDTSSEFFEEEKRKQKEKRDRDRARDIREALDVGEEVEAKDQRWLERYDAKIAEEQAAAEAQAQAEQEGAERESFEGELSELSAESTPLVTDEVMAMDEEMELADAESYIDGPTEEAIGDPAEDTETDLDRALADDTEEPETI